MPRQYHWSPEHLGPIVSGIAREARWLSPLPSGRFTRLVAGVVWGVTIHECRRRLQALVFVGLLVRCGRAGCGMMLYERRGGR